MRTDLPGVAAELLGRREARGSDEHARLGRPRPGVVRRERQAEVDHDRAPLRRHHDVRRLEVAMDHAFTVSRRHRDRHFADQCGGLSGRAGRIARERSPRNVAHHQVVHAVDLADVQHPCQTRMDQPGGLAGLAIETRFHPVVSRRPELGHLESHLDLELQVEGEVDIPHPAAAEPLQKPVPAEVVRKLAMLAREHRHRAVCLGFGVARGAGRRCQRDRSAIG